MKKILKAVAMTFALIVTSAVMTVSVSAKGFVKTDKGTKYELPGGKYATSQMYTVKKNTYYFDKDGIMQTGFVKLKNGTYYFDSDGVMQTGLKKIDKVYYYFDNDGKMCTSTVKVKNRIYTFGKDGKLKDKPTGLITIDGDTYCCEKGKILTGLQSVKTGGKTKKYYFDRTTGKMVCGQVVEDGTDKININAKGEVLSVKDMTDYMLKRRVTLEKEVKAREAEIEAWEAEIKKLEKNPKANEKRLTELRSKVHLALPEKDRLKREYENIVKNLKQAGYSV